MSVEQEIIKKAFTLYSEYRDGEPVLTTLENALEAVRETDDIDAIALAYLLGLQACRTWYIETRPEMRMAQERRDFTNPGKGKTSEAYEEARRRVEELSQPTRDDMETRLTLGYMALNGETDHANRTLIVPIANCIAEIFDLKSANGQWVDMENNVYTNLHGRCSRYIEEHGNDAFKDGKEFLKNINTTLFA